MNFGGRRPTQWSLRGSAPLNQYSAKGTKRGRILRLFQGIQPLFLYFIEEGIEEGTAAAIYDMRRLQYGRYGEFRDEKALLAPDCCLPSLCMMVTL